MTVPLKIRLSPTRQYPLAGDKRYNAEAVSLASDLTAAINNTYNKATEDTTKVTGGDTHDHTGGSGSQIDHVNLSSKGTNTHVSIDSFIGKYSDWTAWTPTGSWVANTTYVGMWKKVGDYLMMSILIQTSGAPENVSLNVNMPAGISIDFDRKPLYVSYKSGGFLYQGASLVTPALIYEWNNNILGIGYYKQNNLNLLPVGKYLPNAWAAGHYIIVNSIKFPWKAV